MTTEAGHPSSSGRELRSAGVYPHQEMGVRPAGQGVCSIVSAQLVAHCDVRPPAQHTNQNPGLRHQGANRCPTTTATTSLNCCDWPTMATKQHGKKSSGATAIWSSRERAYSGCKTQMLTTRF